MQKQLFLLVTYSIFTSLHRIPLSQIIAFSFLFWLTACHTAPANIQPSPSGVQPTVTPSIFFTKTPPSATPRPMLTTTKTSKPNASRTPQPTDTPTVTPTLTIGTSTYQLRTWTEQDSQKWIKKAEDYPGDLIGDRFRPIIAFQSERLLRFPLSENWQTNAWETLRIDPRDDHLPGIPSGQTAFTWLLENLLNQQEVAFADLPAALEKYHFLFADSLSVNNLFGDGQDSFVFNAEVTYINHFCGTFALHKVNGLYQVITIQTWEICSYPATGYYYSQEVPGDTNGNGFPELIIYEQEGHSGIPQTWGENMQWYEWSSSAKAFKNQNFKIFLQTCEDGPCKGEHKFQNKTLTTSEFWYTQSDCPDLEVQHIYLWNGKEYAFLREQMVSAPAAPEECRLAWADEAIRLQGEKLQESGWENDAAINIVAEVLQNWPEDRNFWGPAGEDYFQLRLGIWRDLRGESDAVVELLQPLAAQPSDPRYDFASRMASIYLENRSQQDVFRACVAAENAWKKAILYDLPDNYRFSDLLDRWGFSNNRWTSSMAPAASVEDLCSFQDGLEAGAKHLHISTASDLQHWLEQAGLQTLSIETGDFNEDGKTDYLTLLSFTDAWNYKYRTIWLFVQTSSGVVASEIRGFYSYVDEEISRVSPVLKKYRLSGVPFPISILRTDSTLVAFRIGSDGKAEELFDDFRVSSYAQVEGGISVVTTDWEQNTQVITYTWDPDTGKFRERYAGYDFAGVEHAIEQLLFVDRNFSQAIVQIQTFLVEAPPEPPQVRYCEVNTCVYNPDWYHPYLRYLLGIAYEMAGEPESAVDIYFHLWQDYPKHIFGQAAADKLVLQQP
jgi:hypothetical protein